MLKIVIVILINHRHKSYLHNKMFHNNSFLLQGSKQFTFEIFKTPVVHLCILFILFYFVVLYISCDYWEFEVAKFHYTGLLKIMVN
jgi:hypothetical protein